MTEAAYFSALHELLNPRLCEVATLAGGHYVIEETTQIPFEINTRGTGQIKTIKPEAMKGDWPCFRSPHDHAHKRCDRIVVGWDKIANIPKFLLIELKSTTPGTARKQLGASLAFCHFLHQMVCVGQSTPPAPRFGAITVMTLPFSLKTVSRPQLPDWEQQNLQPNCRYMRYNRSFGSLPIAKVLAAI